MMLSAVKLLTEFVTVTLYRFIGYVSGPLPQATQHLFFLLSFSIPDYNSPSKFTHSIRFHFV